jgi:hypothetical protein
MSDTAVFTKIETAFAVDLLEFLVLGMDDGRPWSVASHYLKISVDNLALFCPGKGVQASTTHHSCVFNNRCCCVACCLLFLIR